MRRIKSIFICIACILVFSPWSAQSQSEPRGPAGNVYEITFDRTYSPAEIDEYAAQLFEEIKKKPSRFTVDVYMIRFTSRYLDGSDAPITAQLFVPRYSERTTRPVYIFAAGTTGLVDACRPSRAHTAGINWGLYRAHVLAHAGQGNIGLFPDYTGFGDPDRLQPYYVPRAEGMMLLDAIRAVDSFFSQRDAVVQPHPAAFLAGYSQGGHAIFAAADYRGTYAPELEIGGIIGYGPARDIEDLFREWTIAVPLITYTYSKLYGRERFNPEVILKDEWLETLEDDVTRMCIGALQSYYPQTTGELYRPEFNTALLDGTLADDYPSIARIMEKNSTGLTGHRIPVIILQGTNDVVAHPRTMNDFVTELREMESDVLYLVYDDARHDTRQISFDRVVGWMDEMTFGE
ncbi:MAG: alpha/beta fold hydrolase [Spirochaetia bacterium]